VRLSP